jgi:hypothetical protein
MLKIYQKIMVLVSMLLTSFCIMAAAVPELRSPVMDTAQMMSPQARQELDQHLRQYSATTGSQIVVLTVPRIAPETPFDYATRVMQSWQLGRSEYNDGVLLLLVRDERKTHLAVGRGLEGAIPDVYAKRLLQDVLRPYLQKGKMDEGIRETVAQTEKLIAGERLPENTQRQNSNRDDFDLDEILGMSVMWLVFSTLLGGMFRGAFGARWSVWATGLVMFLISWLISGSLFIGLLLGVLAMVVAWLTGLGAFVSGGNHDGGVWRDNSSGGFNGGLGRGFGHGGDRFSDNDSGGFSGGGGGFGGGGASGDW